MPSPRSQVPTADQSRKGRQARRIGAQKERATVAWFREQGWLAISNTHGPFDLMASKTGERPRIVEVKYGKHPFDHYGPRDRAATIAAALQGGVDAYLAFWKHRAREPQLIHSSEWPSRNGV